MINIYLDRLEIFARGRLSESLGWDNLREDASEGDVAACRLAIEDIQRIRDVLGI